MITYSVLPEQIMFYSTNSFGWDITYKYITN